MTICTFERLAGRGAALLALLALGAPLASPAAGQGAPRPRTLSGVAYTIRVTGEPRSGSGMMAAVTDPAKSYTATAVYAAARGRLDITEGGVDPAFTKGDYVLFDSTGLVIVHPARREFVIVAQNAGPSMDQLQSMGVNIKLTDLKVTIDSTPETDSVAGHVTRHFRLTTAYNMSVEAAGMMQRLASEVITDYWVAAVPGLPGNPFLRANGFANAPVISGVLKDLSTRVDSVAAVMGSRVALRTVTSSRLMQGPGSAVELRQTSEVSDLHTRDVDESFLTLPASYTPSAMPGQDTPPRAESAAKWRTLPRGRPR